jgi:5-methylthioadenosine/S-adenosylhomocysteine deaminase
MLDEGVHLGLGTDGTASNNDLDLFEELRLASFAVKATSGDPTALPARTTLELATRLGAKALHLDHLIGSIEVGKRADVALVDLDTLHSQPHFRHDPQAIYSQLIYTAKSTDVTDVMVNGAWLMRERQLMTVETEPLLEAAADYAHRIDAFLIEREDSVLSKLLAIGGAEQEESYEVQIKVRLPDPQATVQAIKSGVVEVVRSAHYQEYDTYFAFDDPGQGRLRYRVDEFLDDQGEVFNVRYRLTLIGPAAEREYPKSVLLSRSRFIAPASHSERFYREYFEPSSEIEVHKERLRWLVRFKDKEFFINVDRLIKPSSEWSYLEIKTRTWSRMDAEQKAEMILALLEALGLAGAEVVKHEYPDLTAQHA